MYHHVFFVLDMVSYGYIVQPYVASSAPLLTVNGLPGIIDYTLLERVDSNAGYLDSYRNRILWHRCTVTLIANFGLLQRYYGNMAIVNHQEYRHKQRQQK